MLQKKQNGSRPEIWGGVECTINRIGDEYFDQLEKVGHYQRPSDLSRIAALGIISIRYPILWEKHQPHRDKEIDWTFTDVQLSNLREKEITPIIGLVHHGSGPAFTDLCNPAFADDLAAYAGLVAARYPWIEYYTPVNEPLTTARFSGLYGLWYPHYSDPLQCMTMLLNQVKGIVCSMLAIRSINPYARLVQTEDLSFVHSTPMLAYQAEFENHRRWLTYDFLCGKVDPAHPLWDYLVELGIKPTDLQFFLDNPCVPDVLGVNYYVTSERYLDEAIARHPVSTHGGNGRHIYADVDAVRMGETAGLYPLLQQVWQRYGLPIAITESHLNCTREQQLRWLKETWETACHACQSGIDLRAVTAWALLGSFDWDSLLTRQDGHYEPGAFTFREGVLRLSAIGSMIKELAITGDCHHPLLNGPRWWHSGKTDPDALYEHAQPLLIAGSTSFCNSWFSICHERGISCRLILCPDGHLFDQDRSRLIRRYKAWGIIVQSGLDGPMIHEDGAAQIALDLFIDQMMTGRTAVAGELIA